MLAGGEVHKYAPVPLGRSRKASSFSDQPSHRDDPQPSESRCSFLVVLLTSLLVLLLAAVSLLLSLVLEQKGYLQLGLWQAASSLLFPSSLSFSLASSSSPSCCQQYAVCSVDGWLLWSLHSGRGPLTAAAAAGMNGSLPWSYHSPPPPPSLNPMLWSPSFPSQSPLDEQTILDAQVMCQHMGDLTRDLVYSLPYGHDPTNATDPKHRNIPIPPFPFPSISRRAAASPAPSSGTGTVPPPPPIVPFNSPVNPVAEGFLAAGARVPANYASYSDDGQLLSDTWPDCFNNIHHRPDNLTSLHAFLAAITSSNPPLTAEQLAASLHSSHLNTLGLSLNFDRFPLSTAPVHVPIIITTIDSQRFRDELPTLLTTLRSMPGVYQTTVYIVFEEISLQTLQLLAATVRHFRLVLYFVPIERCLVHRPYESAIGKSWKIDLSMLWSFHVVFNLWDYEYAVLLEDDMDPSMDLYAYHLALHRYAIESPHIMAVAANTYSRYHECFYMGEHLHGRFGVPNITALYDKSPYLKAAADASMSREPQLPRIEQDDLIAWDYRDTHLLVLERLVVPFACGYTRKFFGYLLNFYLQWPGTLETERYDHVTHAVYGSHPNFYTLVPLVPRVHGDRIHYFQARRAIPMLSACQHTDWHIVSPTRYRSNITAPDYGFDVVTATDDDVQFIHRVKSKQS